MQGPPLSGENDTSAEMNLDAVDRAITRGLGWLERTQADNGAWPGDYGGPQFLLPLYVGTCHANGIELDAETRADMARYIRNHQNPDGGWGLHIEGHSQVFTSSLNYVAMRLLGVPAEDPASVRGRTWLREHGGPLASASWGKFFLALFNLYDYRGVNPVPPELWILPESLPIHPSRMWCHCRMIYLPLSWLYGRRVQCEVDDTIRELRKELYDVPYEQVDWNVGRFQVAKTDAYAPVGDVMRRINDVLMVYERRPSRRLRERALDFVLEQVGYEDENTAYIGIGPISKLLHIWVWKHARPHGPELKKHIEVLPVYLCHSPDGTKMNGYNSSELWDTTFAVQAILATGEAGSRLPMVREAHRFIDDNQMPEDFPERERCYRDSTAGSWPFSTKEQGWPVSDCSAEGLKSAIMLQPYVDSPLSGSRLRQAAEFILGMQNHDGGWASYERARGPRWLEALNPSNCFSDIMIDYSYVECTAACVIALKAYQKQAPGALDERIDQACARALDFLLTAQRDDGSFEGSWGVCFTYGTWFGISGLRALGLSSDHPAIARAARFLVGKQLPDGGWGETAESNRLRRYVHADSSQPVMTGWALLGLISAGQASSPAVRRGIQWLVNSQTVDGEFTQKHIAGMFNKTCGIHYENYPRIFPLWALGEYRSAVGR